MPSLGSSSTLLQPACCVLGWRSHPSGALSFVTAARGTPPDRPGLMTNRTNIGSPPGLCVSVVCACSLSHV